MSEYIPVPVAEAKRISRQYEKSIVIICAWDPVHEKIHTTTYGKDALDKVHAANGGEICAKALSADTARSTAYEDFRRDANAARERALAEAIEKHLPRLKSMAEQIIDPKENTFSRMVRDFESALAEGAKV